ncbi:PREDICTED: uncharacterized protein LOC109235155 isoform X3 [Nicotiana attenuata]|uniref:uncharacterized protein LOC109235155 isoform X3 n=1 Tax=Nicotiana attenuata TaxID=49451 RepID=UPI000904AD92|nr:PREDICTED: uncharacterized protein LOC109235155 isoform X3 [Nicotiana attenuata]
MLPSLLNTPNQRESAIERRESNPQIVVCEINILPAKEACVRITFKRKVPNIATNVLSVEIITKGLTKGGGEQKHTTIFHLHCSIFGQTVSNKVLFSVDGLHFWIIQLLE